MRRAGDQLGGIDAHVFPRRLGLLIAPDAINQHLFWKPISGRVAMKNKIRPARPRAQGNDDVKLGPPRHLDFLAKEPRHGRIAPIRRAWAPQFWEGKDNEISSRPAKPIKVRLLVSGEHGFGPAKALAINAVSPAPLRNHRPAQE